MLDVNVEVVLKQHLAQNFTNSVFSVVESYLRARNVAPNTVITNFSKQECVILHDEVQAIIVDDIPNFNEQYIDFSTSKIRWYAYNLDNQGLVNETEPDRGDGEIHLATHLSLPSSYLFNLWENLYYDDNIKEQLLQYGQTMMEFSDKGVDSNVISCNRVILLHGPPGTGKTSLCKALAQKLVIRMQNRYTCGLLVEINSHALFSKWFSESGKLVTKMFSKIKEIVKHENILVCVLIDEIESLAHARNQCISGNEPSDSIRVVNAVLTQIDQIKRFPNVLILATSNMTEAIDLAFIDRADIKQFLGLPSVPAIYKIYYSCLHELSKVGIIIMDEVVTPVNSVFQKEFVIPNKCTKKLLEVCQRSTELSGRSLRKIPFIAHALFYNSSNGANLYDFLIALLKAVEREKKERLFFQNDSCKTEMIVKS